MNDVKLLPADDATRLAQILDVLDMLVRLHDRELDTALLTGLRQLDFAGYFAANLTSEAGQAAAAQFEAAIAGLSDPVTAQELDNLAAEFADLYLTHGYRVSPSGSVWLTEDHLERQQPMFDVREWYEHYDITVPNWRERADDHLVFELSFVSHLGRFGTEVAARDAAQFMDRHVLSWVPEFCAQAVPRLGQPFYVAVLLLTAAVLEELRDMLEDLTGVQRNVLRAVPPSANRELDEEAAYIPGLAESW